MAGLLGNKANLTPSEAVVAGACGGITTRAVISPFDVIKIRFQLHLGPIGKKHGGMYKSVFNAVSTVFRDEGLQAFWKGHTSSQLLSVVYGAVQFGVFQRISSAVWQLLPEQAQTQDKKPIVSFICGGISGMTASFVSQPFDTVRTRMVMQRHPLTYKSTGDAFITILRNEGIRGFYRGLIPNLLQVMPNAGLQFGAYTTFIGLYSRLNSKEMDSLSNAESFLFGACAGLIAKSAVLPFDMTKKRLQVQGFRDVVTRGGLQSIPQYNGVVHCFKTIYRDEGLLGFYKGTVPSLLKAFVSTGMSFMSYNFFLGLIIASREYRNY